MNEANRRFCEWIIGFQCVLDIMESVTLVWETVPLQISKFFYFTPFFLLLSRHNVWISRKCRHRRAEEQLGERRAAWEVQVGVVRGWCDLSEVQDKLGGVRSYSGRTDRALIGGKSDRLLKELAEQTPLASFSREHREQMWFLAWEIARAWMSAVPVHHLPPPPPPFGLGCCLKTQRAAPEIALNGEQTGGLSHSMTVRREFWKLEKKNELPKRLVLHTCARLELLLTWYRSISRVASLLTTPALVYFHRTGQKHRPRRPRGASALLVNACVLSQRCLSGRLGPRPTSGHGWNEFL